MKKHLSPSKIRLTFTGVAIIFALPLSWGILTGFSAWLSPFIMLNSVLTLKTVTFLNLAALLILVISIFNKRFFCKYICPTGYMCDMVSYFSPMKPSVHKKIPDISGPVALVSIFSAFAGLPLLIYFDPLSLFNGFFSVFSRHITTWEIVVFSAFPVLLVINFFLPGIWCYKLCPLGGLQNLSYNLRTAFYRKSDKEKTQNKRIPALNRRHFIAAGAGLTAGLLAPRYLKSKPEPFIRPPGSTEPGIFNMLCIRCGNCIKSCPTKIITHHSTPGDLLSFMTPEIKFVNSYCLEDCNTCSRVCPTGSISGFSISQKKEIIIGKAEIRLDDCLLLNNAECIRCKVSCAYSAIEYTYSEEFMSAIPVLISDQCTGCGACYVMCPAGCIVIVPV